VNESLQKELESLKTQLENEKETRKHVESEKQFLYHELQRTAEHLKLATDNMQQVHFI
jgi:uncharacterized protein (DUF3084 family)